MTISADGMRREPSRLYPTKAAGPDVVRLRMLKGCAPTALWCTPTHSQPEPASEEGSCGVEQVLLGSCTEEDMPQCPQQLQTSGFDLTHQGF